MVMAERLVLLLVLVLLLLYKTLAKCRGLFNYGCHAKPHFIICTIGVILRECFWFSSQLGADLDGRHGLWINK